MSRRGSYLRRWKSADWPFLRGDGIRHPDTCSWAGDPRAAGHRTLPPANHGWLIVPGHRTLRDVESAPRYFDNDMFMRDDLFEVDRKVGRTRSRRPTTRRCPPVDRPWRRVGVGRDVAGRGPAIADRGEHRPQSCCPRAYSRPTLSDALGTCRPTPTGCWGGSNRRHVPMRDR